MNIEIIIYSYAAVCFCVIFFNLASILRFNVGEKKSTIRFVYFKKNIEAFMKLNNKSDEDYIKHRKWVERKFRMTYNATLFESVIQKLYEEDRNQTKMYLLALEPSFYKMIRVYKRLDKIKCAFFPYILNKYGIMCDIEDNKLIDEIFELLQMESIYLRQNALEAIIGTGRCEYIIDAMKTIDNQKHFHHGKLISEALLTFKGNKEKFEQMLWDDFESFTDSMQLTIVNYMRMVGIEERDKLLKLLADEKNNDELRFSVIRYFGKYPYENAYPYILNLAGNPNNRWEYIAIASSSLSQYKSDETIEVLKNNLYNSNWYIRLNSAESLIKMGLEFMDVIDVFKKNDRFAQEIIQYCIDESRYENFQYQEAVSV